MDVTCTASFDETGAPEEGSLITSGATRPPPEGIELAEQRPVLSLAAQALSAALLVSPFFFWGTSMVGMKASPNL